MIRLMIVEDQAMLRDSLACTINTQSDMEVVASLGDAAEALEALERSGATCALLDVCTENDSSGIVAARKIKEAHPEVKVVIMTGMPEITFVEQARTAGVDSFVYKNVGTTELLGIIRSTVEGYSTFPLAQQSIFSDAAQLTDTELAILRLVCETKTRKEIATELYLSEGTVKRHISEILAKTGYDNILAPCGACRIDGPHRSEHDEGRQWGIAATAFDKSQFNRMFCALDSEMCRSGCAPIA